MDRKTQLSDFFLPLVILCVLMFLFHQTPLDEWGAGHFYSVTKSWIYRDNFFLEKILHKGGVLFTSGLLVYLLGKLVFIWKKPNQKEMKSFLGFILISSICTIVMVFFMKRWSTLPCPWDTQTFGGGNVTPPLWEMFSSSLPHAHCFPGGHSSGGYAFLSIYYAYIYVYGKRNFKALLPGLIIGLVFGITQQARGAHFISHDIATMFVSILSSWMTLLIYTYYNKKHECKTNSN
jgi:membrane-associated PAP2 superfamily phosphatase